MISGLDGIGRRGTNLALDEEVDAIAVVPVDDREL